MRVGAIIGGACAAVLAGVPWGGGSAGATSTVTTYTASNHGVVSASRGGAPASSTTTRPNYQQGARSHSSSTSSAAVRPASASGAAGTASSTLLHSIDGVSSLDSQRTNYNLKFEPPDQGLCEGNGFVLEAVNSAYKIYRTDGSLIEGPFNVNDLFNEGGEEFTSDPRCHYDPSTNTWFAIVLFISADAQSSHLDIAVNSSGDPTNFWTEYRFDTTHSGGNGCPCFGDQPRIGIDQYNIYISSDEFSILGPEFNGAQLYAFAKSDLVAGNSAHFVQFSNLHLGGTLPFAIEPAISSPTSDAEYWLNSFDPNNTFDNRIGVWAMTRRDVVASGGSPVLSSTVITSEPYGKPVPAVQKGSTSTLDAGDDRMQQTQYIAGNVWGELTTALTIPGDSTERDGAAWFQVHPTLSGTTLSGATITHQGYVSASNNYLLYPALAADSVGRAAMVFTQTGPNHYPSAAYAVLGKGQTQFTGPMIAANGTGPYDPNATRWGDYSWALRDPANNRFWMATEYMPPKSSQTTTGRRNWGTRIIEVSVS